MNVDDELFVPIFVAFIRIKSLRKPDFSQTHPIENVSLNQPTQNMSSPPATEMVPLATSGVPAVPEPLQAQVNALVQSRMKAFVEDADQQVLAQAEAWNRTEQEFLQRQDLMQQAMAELNAKTHGYRKTTR